METSEPTEKQADEPCLVYVTVHIEEIVMASEEKKEAEKVVNENEKQKEDTGTDKEPVKNEEPQVIDDGYSDACKEVWIESGSLYWAKQPTGKFWEFVVVQEEDTAL